MKRRIFSAARALFASIALASFAAVPVASAAQPAVAKNWKVPKTVDGQPDLQGNWTNATITPLERPAAFSNLILTDEEAHKLEQAEADFVEEGARPTDPKKGILDLPVNCRPGFSGTNCGYNNFWVDAGTHVINLNGEKHSSIIVDPANGRIPAMKPEARQRMSARMAAFRKGAGPADGPEVRSLGERCLMSFGSSAGPPMLPLLYNNNYQIVQNRDTVLIMVEMVHDVRIIHLGGKPAPANVKRWMGDSIGHWEGDTLVVETTNLHPLQGFRGTSDNLKVIERFTRISPYQIRYRFTIEDPTTFDQAWSGELAMNATEEKIYEYACHEGNYALPGILEGARVEERAAAEAEATAKKAADAG